MDLEIFNKSDESKDLFLKKYKFTSEHIGSRQISYSGFYDTNPNIEIGDYVTFEDEIFKVYQKPNLTKTASTGLNIGNSISVTVIFKSNRHKLTRRIMQDYVSKDDTDQYYTATPTFSFFRDVSELAIRVQANLEIAYPDDGWSVVVSNDVLLEEKEVAISNQTIWDALMIANSLYGLDVYFDKNTITIGGNGNDIEDQYSYRNGIKELSLNYDDGVDFFTRLKVYGAERNLPSDYLRDENAKGRYFTNLMLPDFATTQIDYVEASTEVIEEFGIIEGVQDFPDIYPSIEEIDLGNGRIDEILTVLPINESLDYFDVTVRDLGFEISDYWTAETARLSIKGSNSNGTATYLGGYEFEINKIRSSGTNLRLMKNQADNNVLPDLVTTVRAGDRFVLLGIEMPQSYITNAENKLESRALDYFEENVMLNVSYQVKLDPIFFDKNSLISVIKDGENLSILDLDLDVDDSFKIQSISVDYGTNIIPKPEVKLANFKQKTLSSNIDKINSNQTTSNAIIVNSNNTIRTNNNIKVGDVENAIIWK